MKLTTQEVMLQVHNLRGYMYLEFSLLKLDLSNKNKENKANNICHSLEKIIFHEHIFITLRMTGFKYTNAFS